MTYEFSFFRCCSGYCPVTPCNFSLDKLPIAVKVKNKGYVYQTFKIVLQRIWTLGPRPQNDESLTH